MSEEKGPLNSILSGLRLEEGGGCFSVFRVVVFFLLNLW